MQRIQAGGDEGTPPYRAGRRAAIPGGSARPHAI
jgi:hypothetical protein